MRILAVVVTHNRCELLERCLEGIAKQTRPPDLTVVVNNDSSDGTDEMLERRGVVNLRQANLGSAGGWNRGIDHALSNSFDAVWLMDDDGYPDAQALAELERNLAPGLSCVSSVVVREDQPTHFVFPFPVLADNGLPTIKPIGRKIARVADLAAVSPQGDYPFAHLFNGALISTSHIRKVGNVEQRFFMSGDEVDYFFRLRQTGGVRSVLSALHFHPDVSKRPFTAPKVYYYVKNTFILHARYFDWVGLRNCLAVVAVLSRAARRNGLKEAMSYVFGSNTRVLMKAVWRGLRGRLGADFHE